MRGDRDALETTLDRLIHRARTFDTLIAKSLDDLGVVDDVAHRRNRAGLFSSLFDDVERATHTPAIAELVGDHNALLIGDG